jgi:hypothetical protein
MAMKPVDMAARLKRGLQLTSSSARAAPNERVARSVPAATTKLRRPSVFT